MPATAYLVGAGPGDPGLITVRGMRVLAQAQVLVFDSPCHPDMIDLAPAEAERASVGNWPDGSALLVERARAGLTVVRPKSGARSPSVAEAQALAEAGLAFEIVPGTSGRSLPPASPVFRRRRRGCPQRSAMPSCSRDRPQPGTSNLDRLVAGRSTLVLYREPASIRDVANALIRHGRAPETPVAVVEAASSPGQRVFAGDARRDRPAGERGAGAPGDVRGQAVLLRERLAWREKRRLHGRSVAVTGARARAGEVVRVLEELGAEVLLAPCVETLAPPSWEPLDAAIGRMGEFDWLVLTSAEGAEAFLSRLREKGRDLRALGGVRIAAVGSAAAEGLRGARLEPELVAEVSNPATLARALAGMAVGGPRFLVVQAAAGREALPDALRALGASVTVAPASQTACPNTDLEPVRRRCAEGRLSAIAFASPPAVRGFVQLLGELEASRLLAHTAIAAIAASGPATREAIEQLGLQPAIEAGEATARSLVEALAAYLGNSPIT